MSHTRLDHSPLCAGRVRFSAQQPFGFVQLRGALRHLFAGGDEAARVIDRFRDHMVRIVGFRMDSRLANRVDPSDVDQETFVVAWKRIDEFLKQSVSLVVWLKFLVLQKLGEIIALTSAFGRVT